MEIFDRLCDYGCGNIAKFKNKSFRYTCSNSSNSCPVNKSKNSNSLKKLYNSGQLLAKERYQNMSLESKEKMAWSSGLTTKTDSRIKTRPELVGIRFGMSLTGHTEQSKEKIRIKRLKKIESGDFDSSGRKGHRGYYNGIYFHSSWELAFYVYQNEINQKIIYRNKDVRIKYQSDGQDFIYIPDFVIDNQLYEIKGYLFGPRDHDKYQQSKNMVRYIFKEDMQICINYCIEKYGSKFWINLYGEMEKLVNSQVSKTCGL